MANPLMHESCRLITLDDPEDYLVWQQRHDGTVEIVDIAVGSEHRQQGRGRKLLEKLFRLISPDTQVFAITRISNLIAQQFYEKTLFEVRGVLRRFYYDGRIADAVMYGRKAKGPV